MENRRGKELERSILWVRKKIRFLELLSKLWNTMLQDTNTVAGIKGELQSAPQRGTVGDWNFILCSTVNTAVTSRPGTGTPDASKGPVVQMKMLLNSRAE